MNQGQKNRRLKMETNEKKRKINFDKMPHTYAIICAVIILACIMTWVIPSGAFDYETVVINDVERSVPIEGSFHIIEKTGDQRVGLMGFLMSFQRWYHLQFGFIRFDFYCQRCLLRDCANRCFPRPNRDNFAKNLTDRTKFCSPSVSAFLLRAEPCLVC